MTILKKKISLLSGVAIAVSMVVGSGLFGLPGLAIQQTDALTALLAWLGVIALMPALIYVFSWLGCRYPSAEGISLYASKGLGHWSRAGIMMITCGTLAVGMPAFFLVGGSYIAVLLGLNDTQWTIPCALLLAVATTIINLYGVEKLGFINKVIVILVLAVVIYLSIRLLPAITIISPTITSEAIFSIPISQLWLAMSIVFWAFQGWENMTFGFEEIKNPKVNIPLIYWLSFMIVSIVYAIFALAVFIGAAQGVNVSGLNGIVGLLPEGLVGRLILIIMVFILIANANAWVFGSSRAFFSAATMHLLPSQLRYVNHNGIPITMLYTLLTLYCTVILIIYIGGIDIHYAFFLLTTQGFIILYGGAVIAFMKEVSFWWQKVIGIIAGISWIFLMQGFGWLVLYPLCLMLIGTLLYRYHLISD
ncbi:APC family permease [Pelistega ratti]|uniref:APC family permease n=1 Tax=Pelistega ratti TaxID=2652177 RepID=UPI0013578ACE|nr:APC family permease [Pelistega ratti]